MQIRRHAQRGFTLIELMIAVAVVAILAAVAYPSYTAAMVKNRRASAQVVLADIAQRQQQFLLDNRAFAGTPGSCVPIPSALNVSVPADVSDYYTLCVNVGTAALPSFFVTATPITGKSQVSDGTLTITSTGARLPVDKW